MNLLNNDKYRIEREVKPKEVILSKGNIKKIHTINNRFNKLQDEIIKLCKPKYFFIENPRGMLRQQHFMKQFKRDTVTYCKYGFEYMKPTDIWNNTSWIPKPICKANSPCHVKAPRGSRLGIQGTNGYRENRNQKHPVDVSRLKHLDWDYGVNRDALERGKIPPLLISEIIDHCEGKSQIIQQILIKSNNELKC